MRLALACVMSLGLVRGAAAEPCPMFGLESKVLKEDATVSREGGVVVGELPAMLGGDKKPSPDRSKWTLRVKGKASSATPAVLAPGLVVYRPPATTAPFEVLDALGKRVGKAKVMTKEAELLPAPGVKAIVSGESRSRHPSVFVTVELSAAPPKEAIALVVGPAKGPAHAWGAAFPEASSLTVYSTQGGCISMFPDGTVISQPGDRLVAFWVDAYGRRSRVSPMVVVEKAR
jgi:hypothetical protein